MSVPVIKFGPKIPGVLTEAQRTWKQLNGIFCAYKPPGTAVIAMKNTMKAKMCNTLNELQVRPPKRRVLFSGDEGKLTVVSTPAYADHPLVVGPRYIPPDIDLECCDVMDRDWSGLTVWRIGESKRFRLFRRSNPVRTYEVTGVFGKATDNLFSNGKVVEKASFKHVHPGRIAKVLASIIASHQRKAFEYAGVHPDSKEAYELAKTGLVRTFGPVPFIVYGLSLVSFSLPEFKLELHCVGDKPDVVHSMVHDLGLELKTVAHTSAVRRIRFGPFTVDDALLHKHWTTDHVVGNIVRCADAVNSAAFIPGQPWLRKDDSEFIFQSRSEDFEAV